MRLFVLPTLFTALVHVYLWRRLVRDAALPKPWRRAATALICALFASVPLALFVVLYVSRQGPRPLFLFGFGWLGLSLYLVALLVVWDVFSWVRRRVAKRVTPPLTAAVETAAPAQPAVTLEAPVLPAESRRVFVARAVAGSALVATGAIGVWGARSAVWDIVTPEYEVRLARLPRQLDGYSIALVTDIHIGPMLKGRYLRQLVDHMNALKPDLIAIGGDLVDGEVHEIGTVVAELQRLRARDGVHFVTGNHEYYSHSGAWIHFLRRLGINVLLNQRIAVGDATPQGAQFDLAGIADRMGARWNRGPDVLAATRDRDTQRELVMLAHQPVQIADSVRVGAGLQLSGHTHGGQLLPFGAIARVHQPYLSGLHHHPGTDTQIYVSCGAGFWGPPLRVFAPAEIAQIRLVSG